VCETLCDVGNHKYYCSRIDVIKKMKCLMAIKQMSEKNKRSITLVYS